MTHLPPRALLFSGQGAQKVGMGADFVQHSRAATRLYEAAEAQLGWPLRQISFSGPEAALTETRVCQPALYLHGLAMLAAWEERIGAPPRFSAAAGLSLGEYTAHAAAGTFPWAAGLALVAERGRLMQAACESTAGTMSVVLGASPEQAAEIARIADLDVANLNCPGQIVLSGATERMALVADLAKARGLKRVIPLPVAGGYHSRLMAEAAIGLAPHLAAVPLQKPRVPVIANFTAEPVSDAAQIRSTLEAQVCGPVRWEESIRRLVALGITHFVEIGPGKVIAGLLKRIDPALTCLSLESAEDLAKEADALL